MSAEEERLMQLFQNRAGLKKAYADLKDEVHLLHDRLKQQEGATIRVQEQLDRLSALLAEPGGGFGALAFYQLRGLWNACHRQLCAFAADLSRTQEARETARYDAECDADRGARLAAVDDRLRLAMAKAELEQRHLAAAQHELRRLTAVWHYFERRRRDKSLAGMRQGVLSAEAAVAELHAERGAIGADSRGEFPGISLTARRNINLALISHAELLCEQVDAFGLTMRAKESIARRVYEVSFGNRAECEDCMQRVQRAQVDVAAQKQIMPRLKAKMERIRASCEYRNAADTVPTADSLATGSVVWNVLADDYWDLYTVLLR